MAMSTTLAAKAARKIDKALDNETKKDYVDALMATVEALDSLLEHEVRWLTPPTGLSADDRTKLLNTFSAVASDHLVYVADLAGYKSPPGPYSCPVLVGNLTSALGVALDPSSVISSYRSAFETIQVAREALAFLSSHVDLVTPRDIRSVLSRFQGVMISIVTSAVILGTQSAQGVLEDEIKESIKNAVEVVSTEVVSHDFLQDFVANIQPTAMRLLNEETPDHEVLARYTQDAREAAADPTTDLTDTDPDRPRTRVLSESEFRIARDEPGMGGLLA